MARSGAGAARLRKLQGRSAYVFRSEKAHWRESVGGGFFDVAVDAVGIRAAFEVAQGMSKFMRCDVLDGDGWSPAEFVGKLFKLACLRVFPGWMGQGLKKPALFYKGAPIA